MRKLSHINRVLTNSRKVSNFVMVGTVYNKYGYGWEHGLLVRSRKMYDLVVVR